MRHETGLKLSNVEASPPQIETFQIGEKENGLLYFSLVNMFYQLPPPHWSLSSSVHVWPGFVFCAVWSQCESSEPAPHRDGRPGDPTAGLHHGCDKQTRYRSSFRSSFSQTRELLLFRGCCVSGEWETTGDMLESVCIFLRWMIPPLLWSVSTCNSDQERFAVNH